jgi:hypothetical protein
MALALIVLAIIIVVVLLKAKSAVARGIGLTLLLVVLVGVIGGYKAVTRSTGRSFWRRSLIRYRIRAPIAIWQLRSST